MWFTPTKHVRYILQNRENQNLNACVQSLRGEKLRKHFVILASMINKDAAHTYLEFWHFKSIWSLYLQEIQIFLFLPLLFKSLSISYHLISSREQDLNWSLVTSPCFHSTWRGQQHEETTGIWRTLRAVRRKIFHQFWTRSYRILHIFTLMTYLQELLSKTHKGYGFLLLYNSASAEALRVVKEQKKHQNSRGNKWPPGLSNIRFPRGSLFRGMPVAR